MKPTQDRLDELFLYYPETGLVVRKIRVSNIVAGSVVGTVCKNHCKYKYLAVKIDGRGYILSRVVWFMETGHWPKQVDHVNGDPTDNRWKNLRSVDLDENRKNLPLYRPNKSGIAGVFWEPVRGRWVSRINVSSSSKHLYSGNDFFEACCRRKAAEIEYGYHENHGKRAQNQAQE